MFLKKLGLASRTCALQNSLPVLARSLLHNSRNRQIKKAHANMVAGTLGSDVWREEEGAAAGICFYCYNKEKEDLCVLLLKESRRNREAAWTWPGGKRRRDQTLLGRPARETLRATAARETEEETHWQLTAERVGPLLDACQHIVWWADGKYSLFLVHLPDEWEVAAAIHHKVQAKEQHPEALALTGAAWVPLKTLIPMSLYRTRLRFEGLPLHRVPRGIMNQTEVTKILLEESLRLRHMDAHEAPRDEAHSSGSFEGKLGSSAISAAPGKVAGLSKRDTGNADSGTGSLQGPSRSSHSAVPESSRNYEVEDESHSDRKEDGSQTGGTGSWQKRDPMEALSIRRAHGDTPILWPKGVPVSSPQLLPKPQRSIIPSARRQGPEK